VERKQLRPNAAFVGASFWLFIACGPATSAQDKPVPLALKTAILLPGVTGRIDHLAMAGKDSLVFIAALGNNSVEVVDLGSGKRTASITGIEEPQGIVFIPEDRSVLVSSGGTGACNFYDVADRSLKRSIQLDGDADNIRYSPALGLIFIGHGNGGIAVVDAHTFKVIGDIALEGHPESLQVDERNDRLFVNVPDQHEVCVIQLSTLTVIAYWNLQDAAANFPMALDTANHVLFIGCRSPARLLVMSYAGEPLQTLEGPGDMDELFYDGSTATLYAIGGEGLVDLFRRNSKGSFAAAGQAPTREGARTGLLLSDQQELLVAARTESGHPAALLVFSMTGE
jgi:WD40 repeat protein